MERGIVNGGSSSSSNSAGLMIYGDNNNVNGGGCSNSAGLMFFGENVNNGRMPFMFSSPFPLNNMSNPNNYYSDHNNSECIKAKIMSHPHYLRLLAAYINCQKIGAPAEVIAKLEATYRSVEEMHNRTGKKIGQEDDPALDQFMEAYCEMLTKYEQEVTKPFKEAMVFLSSIDSQVKALTAPPPSSNSGYRVWVDPNCEGDVNANDCCIDPRAEDKELKLKLLHKYSGYLGGLKQEFMKKKKKGKLPKEAREKLIDWWSTHSKWPYPSESQKLALAESTGLDQKQINNWFINQRKRHWNASEDTQQHQTFGGTHYPHYYANSMLTTNPLSMDCTPSLL